MTDTIRASIHTIRNGDNEKLRILSFIIQRQPVQPYFMTDTIHFSYIPCRTEATHTKSTPQTTKLYVFWCLPTYSALTFPPICDWLANFVNSFAHFTHSYIAIHTVPPQNLYLERWPNSYMLFIMRITMRFNIKRIKMNGKTQILSLSCKHFSKVLMLSRSCCQTNFMC